MIYKNIEIIINQYQNIEDFKLGNKINPIHIIELSKFFINLNLKNEELLVANYKKQSNPKFLITDFNFYYNDNLQPKQLVLKDFKKDIVEKLFSENEIEIILKIIDSIINKKQENRKTLDSFIEKFRNVVETEKNNFENNKLFFDGKYVDMLFYETDELIKFCTQLNNDSDFIQSLNLIFSNTNQAIDGYKAEHLLINDLIKAYNEIINNENEKSQFSLAYIFERLNGNDFAKGISIQRLNDMTQNDKFKENIKKIKVAKIVQPITEYQQEYLLPSILKRIEHPLFVKSGNLIYRFASIIAKSDNSVSEEEKQSLRNILEKTTKPKIKNNLTNLKEVPQNDSLEIVFKELNELIGLEEVKKSVTDLVNLLKIEKIRNEKGLENIETSLHSVFLGPPGTGKTTVSRLLGRIYKHLGYLSKGHVVETDRAGLVAGYIGQTALKVDEVVKNSLGGVLFIDEAYSLAVQDGGRDFGSEAIDAIVKRMEDNRKELVVIVAGYTEPMKMLIESNPGLRSRFNRYFMFNHFLPTQLLQIMNSFCQKSDFKISDAASDKLMDIFEMLYEKRDEGFGNARSVRNIFEKCVQNQANRLVNVNDITIELLQTIDEVDIPEPKYIVEQIYFTKENEK